MVERSEADIRDQLRRIARSWSAVKIHPNTAGGRCDMCGKYTPPGEDQFLVVHFGEGERVNLHRGCFVIWISEREGLDGR